MFVEQNNVNFAAYADDNTPHFCDKNLGRNLNFDNHVISLCKKAGRKLAVLARLSKFMSLKQKRILMKTFVESRFGYCPLIWMFHSRKVNSKKKSFTRTSFKNCL